METLTTLVALGLTADEAAAYQALIEIGASSVSVVATRAGLKRPTTYLLLGSLEAKGLAHRVPGGRGIRFAAAPPSALVTQAAERVGLAAALAPLLAEKAGTDGLEPKISLFEGASGQRQLFAQVLTRLKAKKPAEIFWLSNWEALKKRRPGELERSFQVHSGRKVKKREIILDTPESRRLVNKYAYPNFEPRFVEAGSSIGVDLGITGDVVALFSLKAPLFGLLIEHPTVAASFRALFELAWQGAKSE